MGVATERGERLMGIKTIDDVIDKLHPIVVDIQTSLDRYILYTITVSLLKILLEDSEKIQTVLDQWLNRFFDANVDIASAKVAEVFSKEGIDAADDSIASMHLLILQSITGVARKTLIELLEAISLNEKKDFDYPKPPSFNH